MDKKNTIRWNVLNHINGLGDSIVNCRMKPERTNLYQTTLMRLNEYFGTTETQSWIMCFGIYQHFNDNYSDKIPISELANFLDVNVLKVAAMHSDFLDLESRNLIEYSHSNSTFSVTAEVIAHVLQNEPVPYTIQLEKNYFDFLAKMANRYEGRKFTEDSCDELVEQLLQIEQRNESLPLVIRCREKFTDDKTRFMFYDLCNDSLSGMPSCLLPTIEDIYESTERFTIAKQFLDEKHPLIESKFVEFNQKGNMFEAQVKLTEEGKKFFLDEDYELYACRIDESKLKKPEDIRAKKLFYSEQNQKQIEDLTSALSQSNYKRIRNRLKEKGLPCGIAVMLYGLPGCGKTESVYQLAKKTGRAIMHVDISQTKSCWVGESEKLVKKIFTDYKALCDQTAKLKNGRIPILFFNECDGVLSRRQELGDRNTTQLENAIQNILLEEIENLDGILIATTNLVDNLDSAFERRFLFKIQFEKPSVEAKKAIWKNKIPWLSVDKAAQLATAYNFSGGEIDNIVRKAQMKEIISGSRPAYNDIVEMCKVEKLYTAPVERRVGFV